MTESLKTAEEVLLENVELILEAFDYLQLPFALKHGNTLNSVIWFMFGSTIFYLLSTIQVYSF